eukprot:1181756-Prorocentrum_minimum.AAC.1
MVADLKRRSEELGRKAEATTAASNDVPFDSPYAGSTPGTERFYSPDGGRDEPFYPGFYECGGWRWIVRCLALDSATFGVWGLTVWCLAFDNAGGGSEYSGGGAYTTPGHGYTPGRGYTPGKRYTPGGATPPSSSTYPTPAGATAVRSSDPTIVRTRPAGVDQRVRCGHRVGVWCGICGSTEHRSAECDCWAQWGAAAGDGSMDSPGSPGEVSDDIVEELLTSDSSDGSDAEEGEYAPP